MKLLSIQVGRPKEVEWQGKSVLTGIFKSPVPGPVEVATLGLDGDGQADPRFHGGPDKAVYGFGDDAYGWFRKRLGRELEPGIFGENLTFEKLDERTLCLGDELTLGSCRLQVSEPRFPCFKLGLRFGDPGILRIFIEGDRPGVYFRVLQEGEIRPGEELKVVVKDPVGVSLWDLWDVKMKGLRDPARMKKILGVKSLSRSWRETLHDKLP